MKKYKTYIIEGKEFTTPEVAEKLNCSFTAARGRLGKSNTIEQLAKELNCSITSARSRIHSAKTLEELYVPIIIQDGDAHTRRSLNNIDPELIKLNKLLYGKW